MLDNAISTQFSCAGLKSTYNQQCPQRHYMFFFFRLTKDVILKTQAKVIYVATDKNPYIDELESYLKEEKV